MSTSTCPTRSQLEDLIAGRLPFERHEALEEHMRGCPSCQAEVDALVEPHDAFLSTLRDVIDPAAIRAKQQFQRVLAQLMSLHNGPTSDEKATPESPLPHPILGSLGDFRIIGELGHGGMGIVYEAEQVSLGRRVALKILPFAAVVDPRQLQRFQNESRAAASLEHPNIVPVYGVGVERGVHYYVMRYIDGRNLAQVIEELRQSGRNVEPDRTSKPARSDATPTSRSNLKDLLGTPSPRDAAYLAAVVRIGIQTAEALDYARERGVVHRDIKPSNLMLDQTGKVWVTDFGLARIETNPSMSMIGAILGTLRYMSPEQALDHRGVVDHRSDLYSLGATLYELLTLTPVFADAAPESLLSRIATDEPRAPRRLNTRIPADLETIVLKALSKNAAERYATAGEFAADLMRFRQGKPIQARAVGPIRRALKWARRRPAATALLAISGLAVLVLTTEGWWHAASLQTALNATEQMRNEAVRQRESAVQQESLTRKHEFRARQFAYAADMKLAFAAWKNTHIAEVLDRLSRHRPQPGEEDARNFVWHYLWRLCHADVLTLRGHVGDVHGMAFSPDGRLLATVSHDGTAKLWDVVTGVELATLLKGHKQELNAVAFSPDGKTLATGGDDQMALLWDAVSGQQRAALLGHTDDLNTVAFSPDGRTLASGGADHVVILWDAATGNELATLAGHRGAVESLAFSPDGKTLATASGDRTAVLWDLATRQPRTTLSGHADVLRSVAFAHGSPIVATGSEDRSVKLWDAATGRVTATLQGHSEVVRCVAFSPDDRTLAVAVKDGSVWLWDVAAQRVWRTIRGHTGRIWQTAFSPDGRMLATASGDRSVKLWDAATDRNQRVLSGPTSPVTALAFSSDDRQLAAASADTNTETDACFRVWDVTTGVEQWMLRRDGQVGGMAAFAPDGGSVVTIGPSPNGPGRHESLVHAVADHWECTICTLRQAPEHVARIHCMALSPDHQTLATAHPSGDINLWELNTGRQRARMAPSPGVFAISVAFSPDGRTVAVGRQDGVGQLWDVATGKERATLRGHTHEISSVAFSTDGRTLATASDDRTVRLWDVATASQQATLQGHSGAVHAVAFSPDGKTVASGSTDCTVRLWDVATRQELIALESHQGGVLCVTFAPSGKVLASGGAALDGKGEIFVWYTTSDDGRELQ